MAATILRKVSQGEHRNRSVEIDLSHVNRMTKLLLLLGIIVRVIIYYYSLWHDNNFDVKFTDVDYYVYSDAAKYILRNESPYKRYTYRYTPLLAYLMVPNFLFHFSFGKILFSSFDFLIAIVLIRILRIKYPSCKNYIFYVSMWILNPMVIIISIRGNADCIPCLFVFLTLLCIYQKKIYLAAIFYGLAVNFKIYPIIYALPLMLYLNKNYLAKDSFFQGDKQQEDLCVNPISRTLRSIAQFSTGLIKLNRDQLVFSLCSFSTFMLLNGIFYRMYGYTFLHESFIYHLVRRDHRHNFSLFFYLMYLTIEGNSKIIPLITFVPQAVLVALFGFKYARANLELSMFLQTLAFIAMNKVCTSQYFIWCLPFIPVVLHSITLNRKNIALIAGAVFLFILAKANWLLWAYYLEFKGYNTFLQLFYSSVLFLISEMIICWVFMYLHFAEQKKEV
ncbi:GPI mannosyltransferase I, putative [Plasmodium knowlesi strain H]|uniref:GPI mannosyltransferase 1 n=3 Tax=Plasmodium knowlesi TaxID=5850 RepID=A0A5E7X4I0_PLAKH|nr:GPI mannosyltransferase 1, putative [Plasmodium knowlesi strain H]OTN66637.1 putative GPI mannosyltransferase I [Plasmodium knowlesi]CAA9990148.1 GPI mannosyltransferase 1, putative [Plasmodium knowlesi strain H]SBO25837.1 GPI mannosyltransferase I, putative [Plasmodium knowlesi strain H]SBO28621.1 GPI mannosyltransferase I, putative [Plasmodium knowlesi strain H]VVS79622.1 GPI mannosyltransferase 1, putative [Plasmodium knowlesi strain H]